MQQVNVTLTCEVKLESCRRPTGKHHSKLLQSRTLGKIWTLMENDEINNTSSLPYLSGSTLPPLCRRKHKGRTGWIPISTEKRARCDGAKYTLREQRRETNLKGKRHVAARAVCSLLKEMSGVVPKRQGSTTTENPCVSSDALPSGAAPLPT